MAVAHADQIIQIQSDLDHKELPPDWMYQVPWLLSDHLKSVVAARKKPKSPDEDEGDWDDEDTYEVTDPDIFSNWR